MMKRTLISTAVAFALSVPFAASVPAQEAKQGSQQQTQMSEQQGNQQQKTSRIKVASPFDLVGHPVLEQEGQEAGELAYVI